MVLLELSLSQAILIASMENCIKGNKDNSLQYESRRSSRNLNSKSLNYFWLGICNIFHIKAFFAIFIILYYICHFNHIFHMLKLSCAHLMSPMSVTDYRINLKFIFWISLWRHSFLSKGFNINSIKISNECSRELEEIKFLLLKLYNKSRISLFDM